MVQRADQKDKKQPGLYIRTSPRTQRTLTVKDSELVSYRVVYKRRSDRKTRQMTLGKASQISLAEARRRTKTIMGQVAEGKDPAAQHDEWASASTFGELARQWLAFKIRQGRAQSYTYEADRRIKGLPDWFTAKKASDIQRVDIAKVLESKAASGKQTETNRHHSLISAILKWALSEGHIQSDPSQGLKRCFDEKPRERAFSDDELRAIWHGIDDAHGSAASKVAVKLCFVLGQRPNEIVTLRRDQLGLDGPEPMLAISGEHAKNRIKSLVPLPYLAVDLFRQALELAGDSEWVFPNPSKTGSVTPKSLTKMIARTKAANDGMLCGVPDAQLYDAKKTIATFLGDAGYPNELIGILFNQISVRSGNVTGRHYNHSGYLNTKRQLIEEWARHLATVVGLCGIEPHS